MGASQRTRLIDSSTSMHGNALYTTQLNSTQAFTSFTGTVHDALAADDAIELAESLPPGFFFIADTGFPRSGSVYGKIVTSLRDQDMERLAHCNDLSPVEQQQLAASRLLVQARQPAEWGNRTFKGSFARTKLLLPSGSAENDQARFKLFRVCVGLLNFRARVMGYGQIRSVFSAEFFKDGLSPDKEDYDRVKRFYHIIED